MEDLKKLEKETEKKLNKIYLPLAKNIKESLKEILKKMANINKETLTEQQILKLLREHKKDIIKACEKIYKINKNALVVTNALLKDIYKSNYNNEFFQVIPKVEKQINFAPMTDRKINNLIKKDKNLLEKKIINKRKDINWNKKKIENILKEGFKKGHSIERIANNLKELANVNRNSAIRIARTSMTSIGNKAKFDSYKEMKRMGLDVYKKWIATLGSRTRESHARLDKQTVKIYSRFSNGLNYPGDTSGSPSEVYNCRCTMVLEIKEQNGGKDKV